MATKGYSIESLVQLINDIEIPSLDNVDAVRLNGELGSYYLDFNNFTNLPDPTITLSGDVSGTGTLTDLGDVSITTTVADDSHNHSSSTGTFTVGGDLTVSGGDIVLTGSGRIQGIDVISVGTDAVNKTYVDNAVASSSLTPTNVGNAYAGLAYSAVGTYVFAYGGSIVSPGDAVSGSSLTPVGVGFTNLTSGTNSTKVTSPMALTFHNSTLPGTWRCMGYSKYGLYDSNGELYSANAQFTLWLRIA